MAIENAKTLNVRIRNKYDSYENWASSSLVLEAGEIAIAYTTVDVKVDNGTAKHPALLMKVGDGEKTFANLPWLSAKAADVLSVCKNETDLTAFVNGVIANAGIATDKAMQELAGKVTTAEGKITTLEGKMTTAEGKITTAEGAIDALELLVGDKSVNTQIQEYVAGLNLATTYAAKSLEATVDNHIKDTVAHVTADDKTKWNASLQVADIAAGTANGTIKVRGTDIAVTGLGSAAYTASTAYDAAGAADGALASAKTYAEEKAAAAESAAKSHAETKASAAETAAKSYADEKAAAAQTAAQSYADGKAADAEKNAKDYVDGLTGGESVSDYVSGVITNYSTTAQMNAAIATAKGEAVKHADDLNSAMDKRVQDLEAIDHSHTFVESELNLIQAGDVAKWNAAEQNAKDYADAEDAKIEKRVEDLEAKFTGDDSVADQIADAVAAEAALREAADTALQNQIGEASAEGKAATGLHARIEELENLVGDDKVSEAIAAAVTVEKERAEGVEGGLETRLAAVEDDYLTSADKTELEGKITTNANAIERLTNGVSAEEVDGVNDLIQYVKDHGTEVTGIKADIKANADAIDAIEADYLKAADKTELSGLITGLDTRMGAAETAIGTKAAQADLETLAGRVTTVENDLNTENTGLKARMTAAEADIDALETKVGDKTVAAQIEAAIEALKIGDYAKAADLTAAINQHNTDKAALEAEIAKKANDADLAAIAKTGSTDDLVQGEMVLLFDCGNASV